MIIYDKDAVKWLKSIGRVLILNVVDDNLRFNEEFLFIQLMEGLNPYCGG